MAGGACCVLLGDALRRRRMNGTRNWCTLVDLQPEGQPTVRRRSPAPARSLFLVSNPAPPSHAPRRGR